MFMQTNKDLHCWQMWLRKVKVYHDYYLSNLWEGRINESNVKIFSSCESLFFAVSPDVLVHLFGLRAFGLKVLRAGKAVG
jgi:hypothetical protein